MSAIITPAEVKITVAAPSELRNKKRKNFESKSTIDLIKTKWEIYSKNKKLASAWLDRNLEHGEVFMASLETNYIFFQQNIFVKEENKLIDKLTRVGFYPLKGFPDEEKFDFFSSIFYHPKYNIAISIYSPENEIAIKTSYEIVKSANIDDITGLQVFLSSVKILMQK